MDVYQRFDQPVRNAADEELILTHEQRLKGRLKAVARSGEEVRLFLERGKTLLPGELLQSECGRVIRVEAAVEEVMLASCDDWLTFSRACYHLGNRHVKIEVGERQLKITPDHVLQQMLEQLGLQVETVQSVFVPESGAYQQADQTHAGHAHSHRGHHHEHH